MPYSFRAELAVRPVPTVQEERDRLGANLGSALQHNTDTNGSSHQGQGQQGQGQGQQPPLPGGGGGGGGGEPPSPVGPAGEVDMDMPYDPEFPD